jgi:hypothetical protein
MVFIQPSILKACDSGTVSHARVTEDSGPAEVAVAGHWGCSEDAGATT